MKLMNTNIASILITYNPIGDVYMTMYNNLEITEPTIELTITIEDTCFSEYGWSSLEELSAAIEAEPEYHYSNEAWGSLDEWLEAIEDQSFAEYCERNLLDEFLLPLELTETLKVIETPKVPVSDNKDLLFTKEYYEYTKLRKTYYEIKANLNYSKNCHSLYKPWKLQYHVLKEQLSKYTPEQIVQFKAFKKTVSLKRNKST